MGNTSIKEIQTCIFDSMLLFCKEKVKTRCAHKRKKGGIEVNLSFPSTAKYVNLRHISFQDLGNFSTVYVIFHCFKSQQVRSCM